MWCAKNLNQMTPEIWSSLAQIGPGDPEWLVGPRATIAAAGYVLLLLAGMGVNLYLFLRWAQTGAPIRWVRLAARPWSLFMLLRIAAVLLFLQLVVLFGHKIQELMGVALPAPDDVYWIVEQSLMMQVAGVALVAATLVRHRLSWSSMFGSLRQWKGDVGRGFLYYLAALPFVWMGSLVFIHILQLFGYTPDMQETALLLSADASLPVRFYLISLAVLLAPLFEEMIFRGTLLPLLMRRMSPLAALAVVSLVFASIHMHPSSMAALFIIAYAFGLAYLKTGRLLVPMTMHALFNAVNLGALLFMR